MASEIHAQDVIILIIYLVLLVLGAYFLTRYVAKRSMQKGMKKPDGKSAGARPRWKQGRYVSVLDRIPIDRDKTIMVVEFGGKRYLMATAGQDIKLLDKLKKEEDWDTETEKAETDFHPPSPNVGETQEEGGFFERFFGSFKIVFKNYFKRDAVPFGVRLQKEMQQGSESEHGKQD